MEEVIAQVEEKIEGEKHTKTCKVIEKAREILEDPKFIEQKSIRSLVDQDARVGYKSKTESFFGYKNRVCNDDKKKG